MIGYICYYKSCPSAVVDSFYIEAENFLCAVAKVSSYCLAKKYIILCVSELTLEKLIPIYDEL